MSIIRITICTNKLFNSIIEFLDCNHDTSWAKTSQLIGQTANPTFISQRVRSRALYAATFQDKRQNRE